jgi:hypothetical protein
VVDAVLSVVEAVRPEVGGAAIGAWTMTVRVEVAELPALSVTT